MTQNSAPPDQIYNSRIIDTFVKFLRAKYPQVNIHQLLSYAGMTPEEVADEGHWFSQHQIDRFSDRLVELTGNSDIAREAGRFAASPEALGLFRQYVLGLLSPDKVLELIGQTTEKLTRSAAYRTRKLARNRFEISVIPHPGIEEKPFQCANRVGFFEAIGALFDFGIPDIEHPECLFEGRPCCRYVISWKSDRASIRKKLKILVAVLYGTSLVGILTLMPFQPSASFWHGYGLLGLCLYLLFQKLDKDCLRRRLQDLRDTTEKNLQQINLSYSNALIINEIGQTISRETDIDVILANVVKILKTRLNYQRCFIYLANPERTRLVLRQGFSVVPAQLEVARKIEFQLDKADSQGLFVASFKQKRPILINDIDEVEELFSSRSLQLARELGVKSFICCPIICDGKSQGILAVDNYETRRTLVKSDLSLLMGIASTLGVSIRNAELLQTLQGQLDEIRARDRELERHREILEEQVAKRTQELNEALQTARELAEQAKEASREKSRFLANMSHEIRTPLYGVLGMTEILLKSGLDESQRSKALTVHDSGKMLLRIIDDILDLSKIEAGKLEFESIPFSLRDALGAVLALFSSLASDKGIYLTLEIPEHLPDALRGDTLRLRQVLANLVSNAIKFTEQGGVVVRVEQLADSPHQVTLGFTVEDSGIGIPADKLEQIFEGFTQAEGDTTRKYGGTGLGTTIARHLVELQQGEIGVESSLGKGSRFWFRLAYPKAKPEDLAEEFQPDPVVTTGGSPEAPRILLVDDNRVNLEISNWHLVDAGYRIELADNGSLAVDKALTGSYDLILMDIQMPVMDGYTATSRIRRSSGRLTAVPIVGLTANASQEERRKSLEAGMNDVLAKPLSRQELLAAVRHWTADKHVSSKSEGGKGPVAPTAAGDEFLELLAEFNGNEDFLVRVTEIFVSGSLQKINLMKLSLREGDCRAIAGYAHAIRGSAGNLMGHDLAEAARELEELSNSEALAALPRSLARLEAELSRYRDQVEFHLMLVREKNRKASSAEE